jgi:hypothetical protein
MDVDDSGNLAFAEIVAFFNAVGFPTDMTTVSSLFGLCGNLPFSNTFFFFVSFLFD